ncbi:hypothetical protein [Micromonospora haikouensis]|uniref:hypothetical protein n=1 Tax=Micromonospora haikouensis TaxID=686309 RepID=UPI003D934571
MALTVSETMTTVAQQEPPHGTTDTPPLPLGQRPLEEAKGLRTFGWVCLAFTYLCGLGAVGGFIHHDPEVAPYRTVYLVIALLGIPAAVWAFRKASRARRTAVAQYGALLPPERPWYRRLRLAATIMWSSLALAAWIDLSMNLRWLRSSSVAAGLVAVFVLAVVAVTCAASLISPAAQSVAHRAERLAKWREQIDPLSARLAADINAQLRSLEEIRDERVREDQLRELIRRQTEPVLERLLDRAHQRNIKQQIYAGRTQLAVATVIGIITGLLVNWISGPLLHW